MILKSSRNVAGFELDGERDVSSRKRGKMRGRKEEMFAIFSLPKEGFTLTLLNRPPKGLFFCGGPTI